MYFKTELVRIVLLSVSLTLIMVVLLTCVVSSYASCNSSSCDKSCNNARYSTKNLGCFTSGLAGGKCETTPDETCGSCKCKPESLVQDSSCSCKS